VKYWTLLLFLALADGPQPPAVLEQALRSMPGLRLLDPSLDLIGAYTVDQLQELHLWPPWFTADLDRDGHPDVAAVVVRPGSRPEFGVIALHARTPGVVRWIVPLGADAIDGVAPGPAPDTVRLLSCLECNSNPWYRWSGREYERELYTAGEQLLASESSRKESVLFEHPRGDSKPVVPLEGCEAVLIRRVGGASADRWYLVDTSDGHRGWIPAKSVAPSGTCIG